MELVNIKILLFIAMTLAAISIAVLGMKQHMDAAVHERIEVDQTYEQKTKEDIERFKRGLELGR